MSRSEEFRNRLKRWEEEYYADPNKTEITQQDINNLKMLIKKLEEAELDVKECEQLIDATYRRNEL